MTMRILTLNKKNITDFALERNKLLDKAKSEWLFFVDTDEEISSSLRDEINVVTSDPNNKFSGYFVKRKIYFCGVFAGQDKVLRLARKGAGRWRRSVHEVWDVKGPTGILKNHLVHNTYSSISDAVGKINNYSTLHALENEKEGKKVNLFKIIFFPKIKFVQNILMGRPFVFAILQSFHSFLSWSKLYFLRS